MSGIYSISLNDDILYVGQSKNIKERWRFHKYELKNNIHKNVYLQRLYNKYGDLFVFNVVEYVDELEFLTGREINHIKALKPKCNMILPDENDNWLCSPIRNAKISKALLGKKKSDQHRNNISIGRTGVKHKIVNGAWNAKLITYNNITLPISTWEEKLGMKPNSLNARLRRGWSVADAIQKPIRDIVFSPTCRTCGVLRVKTGNRMRCPKEWKHRK